MKDKASASADLDGIAREGVEAFKKWFGVSQFTPKEQDELREIFRTFLARATAVDEEEEKSLGNETPTTREQTRLGTDDLLPCPFCGGKAILDTNSTYPPAYTDKKLIFVGEIECVNRLFCGTRMASALNDRTRLKENLTTQWNKRVQGSAVHASQGRVADDPTPESVNPGVPQGNLGHQETGRDAADKLAMMCLQSNRYTEDHELAKAVDDVLAWTRTKSGQSPDEVGRE